MSGGRRGKSEVARDVLEGLDELAPLPLSAADAAAVAVAEAWPDPTPEMLEDPFFGAIWDVIKAWDVGVARVYQGHCGATGNHARAIYDAIAPSLTAAGAEVLRLRDELEQRQETGVQLRAELGQLLSEAGGVRRQALEEAIARCQAQAKRWRESRSSETGGRACDECAAELRRLLEAG